MQLALAGLIGYAAAYWVIGIGFSLLIGFLAAKILKLISYSLKLPIEHNVFVILGLFMSLSGIYFYSLHY